MFPFTDWQTFAQVLGSATAALTGLQFVAMALIADMPMRSGEEGVGAFVDPTIVHFVVALLLAASLAMPWHGSLGPTIAWSVAGLCGVVYVSMTAYRMHRQTTYKPVLEDWLFHACLPLCAYAGLLSAGLLLKAHVRGSLFGIAGVDLLLLIVGTHNSWDNLTFLVLMRRQYLSTGAAPETNKSAPGSGNAGKA